MSTRIQNDVVKLASKKHRQYWKIGSDVSEQTKSAQFVCGEWQKAVKNKFGERFSKEHSVGDGFKEKIDLVDLQDAVAYELKVSKNNTHFEFYRDIFKVAVHNKCGHCLKIKKLVFITPKEGADRLLTVYGNEVRALAEERHFIEVEIYDI
jgi:hypothetical protein